MPEESKHVSLNINNLILPQQPLIPKPPEYLGSGNYIELAIPGNALHIPFFIIYRSDLTAVQILFWGGNPQDVRKQAQGGIVFVVPEFP